MIKYIRITRHIVGNGIAKQIQDIIDAGMMDKDTRLFFNKNSSLTMEDIKPLFAYFDIRCSNDIDNVVFAPNDYFIDRFVEHGINFGDKKW